jgi:hypothetical protein
MKKILFFVLFIIYLVLNVSILKDFYLDFGDVALISLKVEFAKQFNEYLGPYSRMGFFHPGPVIFYLYAFLEPFLKFLIFFPVNSVSFYYYIAQFLINFLFLVLIFDAFPKSVSHNIRWIFLLIYLILLENLNNTSFSLLFDVWGPVIIIFPLLLLMISLTTLFVESHRYELFFYLFLSLSMILSNHLSGMIYAGLFSFFGLIWFFYKNRIAINKKSVLWISFSILWLILSFLPIIYEFFINYPDNNIFKIIEVSRKTSSLRKGNEVIKYFGELWSIFILGKAYSFLGWMIYLSVNLFLYNRLKKIENLFIKYLYRFSLIQTVLLFFYIVKIPYDLLHYLSWFYYSIASLYILIVIILLFEEKIFKDNYKNIYIIILLIFLLFFRLGYKAWNQNKGFYQESLVLKEIKKQFVFDPNVEHKIEWGFMDEHHNNWVVASGIVLNLYKNHIPVCVDKNWLFMFGKEFDCKNPLKTLFIKKIHNNYQMPEVKIEDNLKVLYYFDYQIYLK